MRECATVLGLSNLGSKLNGLTKGFWVSFVQRSKHNRQCLAGFDYQQVLITCGPTVLLRPVGWITRGPLNCVPERSKECSIESTYGLSAIVPCKVLCAEDALKATYPPRVPERCA